MEDNLIIKQCKCGACARSYYIETEEIRKDLKFKCPLCKTELKYERKTNSI